jgi:hypothetical protein
MFDLERAKWLCERPSLRIPPTVSDIKPLADYLPLAVAEIERLRAILQSVKACSVTDEFDPGNPIIHELACEALEPLPKDVTP